MANEKTDAVAIPVVRGVAFDLDGLMFNTEDLYQYVGDEIVRRRGKTLDHELLDQMIGRKAAVALQRMIDWYQLDDTVEGLAAESAEIFAEILDQRLETMPGLLQLLDALEAAQIPKGIATSSGRAFTRQVLQRFELEPRFQFVLTGDDIERGKPHPDIYLKAASLFPLPPREMLVLEDSQAGCQAAVACGAFTVAVPNGVSERHDFAQVDLVARSLSDPRIYQALGLAVERG